MTPSQIEKQLGLLVMTLDSLGQAKPNDYSQGAIDEQERVQRQAMDGLREQLKLAIKLPEFGRLGLPDRSSWVKGLARLDWELAGWWVEAMGDRAWPKDSAVLPCQEIINDKRLISPNLSMGQKIIRQRILARSFDWGVPLSQATANEWSGQPWTQDKEYWAPKALDLLEALCNIDGNDTTRPLICAYMKKGGAVAFNLPGRSCIPSSVGLRLKPLDAARLGLPMDAHSVGIESGVFWWESAIDTYLKNDADNLIEIAQAKGLSTLYAHRKLAIKRGKAILEAGEQTGEREKALLQLHDHLSKLPEGPQTPTPSGSSLAWQYLVARNTGAMKQIIQVPIEGFDLIQGIGASGIWENYLAGGSFSRIGVNALAALLKKVALVRQPGQPPLLQQLLAYDDWGASSRAVEMVNRLASQDPQSWFGSAQEQLDLAKASLSAPSQERKYAWIIGCVPTMLALQDRIEPELLLTARTFDVVNYGGHSFKAVIPSRWPTPSRSLDSGWLDLAKASMEGNVSMAWYLAELDAMQLEARTPGATTVSRPRL